MVLQTAERLPWRQRIRYDHRRIIRAVSDMIGTILDACREVLEINGDPQSAYWLTSQMMEMRMWRASEHAVRAALDKDIRTQGERSLFVKVAGDEFTLRAWKKGLRWPGGGHE